MGAVEVRGRKCGQAETRGRQVMRPWATEGKRKSVSHAAQGQYKRRMIKGPVSSVLGVSVRMRRSPIHQKLSNPNMWGRHLKDSGLAAL